MTGVQTCALPIYSQRLLRRRAQGRHFTKPTPNRFWAEFADYLVESPLQEAQAVSRYKQSLKYPTSLTDPLVEPILEVAMWGDFGLLSGSSASGAPQVNPTPHTKNSQFFLTVTYQYLTFPSRVWQRPIRRQYQASVVAHRVTPRICISIALSHLFGCAGVADSSAICRILPG